MTTGDHMTETLNAETPTILSSVTTSNVLGYNEAVGITTGVAYTIHTDNTGNWNSSQFRRLTQPFNENDYYHYIPDQTSTTLNDEQLKQLAKLLRNHKEVDMPNRRLVQVFIVDPDINVPLDKALLYKGDQILTENTDQELFFDIDVKSLLEDHNVRRTKIVDKEASKTSGEKVYLEKTRIKDLKMIVNTLATF
jgi:hypothetical protein